MFIGTSSKRRNEEIALLNKVYGELVPVKRTLNKCLKYLCQNKPYRMLSDWTYEMSAEPLPGDEPASVPEFTDVGVFYFQESDKKFKLVIAMHFL